MSIMSSNLFSTQKAAKYLKVSVATIKYHLYTTRLLKPHDRVGKNLVFIKDQLDALKVILDESKPRPSVAKIDLPPGIMEQLGKKSDVDLAAEACVSSRTIFRRRKELGIPAFSAS